MNAIQSTKQTLLTRIAELKADTTKTWREIAAIMNAEGYTTIGGKAVSKDYLSVIFSNKYKKRSHKKKFADYQKQNKTINAGYTPVSVRDRELVDFLTGVLSSKTFTSSQKLSIVKSSL